MRNVERQAKALKLAMEAASDIQANPTWDYAHVVASIQAAILDMDEEPGKSSQVETPLETESKYSMGIERKDKVVTLLRLSVPDGHMSYRIFNQTYPFEKLMKYLEEGTPLGQLRPIATSQGFELTYVERGYEYKSVLKCTNSSEAYRIAEKFLTHVFKNTPLQGTAQ